MTDKNSVFKIEETIVSDTLKWANRYSWIPASFRMSLMASAATIVSK